MPVLSSSAIKERIFCDLLPVNFVMIWLSLPSGMVARLCYLDLKLIFCGRALFSELNSLFSSWCGDCQMLFQGHIFSSSPFPASQRQCWCILKHIHPGLKCNPFGSFVAVEIKNTGFAKELPKHRYVTLSSASELQVHGNQYLSGCSALFIFLKQFLLTFNGLSQCPSVLCCRVCFL